VKRTALLVLCATSSAYADDPRDVFGIKPRPVEQPLDCSDGTDFGCVRATDPFADAAPLALASWLPAKSLLSLPVGDATHDQVAHYAMASGQDGAGPVFGGATGLENRWTIEGAPSESVRTGGAENAIPLAFLDGILVTAGGFAARDRTSTGGTIEARLRRGGDHHEVEVYAWAGWASRGRHPEIAADTYQLRRGAVDPSWSATAAVVATGPLDALGAALGGKAWYAAGIAPSIQATDFRWTAGRLADVDQDGVPDGFPGVVTTQLIEHSEQTPITYFVPAMARAGLDHGPHHVDVSLVGNVASSVFNRFNSTISAAGTDTTSIVGDAIATYRGEWHDTHVRAQFAWHRATRRQSAHEAIAANQPELLSAYVPTTLPDDPPLAGACNDASMGDVYPKITNCPIPAGFFASGGAGELVDTTADRPSLTADIAHRLGNHVARVGATGEDARFVSESRFTGGSQIISLFPMETAVREFIAPDQACDVDPAKPCATVPVSELAYRTRYSAAYVEDTWRPTPEIVTDAGLRWELMWVGPALHLSREFAPRFGASWDPYGGGRSRVWVSAGRSYAVLPAGLGHTILGTDRTVDNVTSPFGPGRNIETGAPIAVIDGIKPVSQDELTLGGEIALYRTVRARAWMQGRWLARGIGLTSQGLDNPGRDHDVPPASRSTGLVAFELETAPTAKLVLRVGYTYSSTIGSYIGPYSPREGAILYASEDYLLPSSNLVGALPTDLGHRVYVEARRHGRFGEVAWQFATRLTLASGRPRDVLVDGSEGLVYGIPRGDAGRNPMLSQANIRLGASWRGFDVTLDFVNLFDQHTPTFVDPLYASGSIHPIQGGSYEDLVFLRDSIGRPAVKNPTYELGLAFQSPLEAMLGIHHAL
jgi:hypothetical protein